MKTLIVNVLMGVLLGFILSRAGVAEFDHVTGMFALRDFHMFGVIGLAVPVSAFGLFLLRGKKSLNGLALPPKRKNRHPGNFPGGFLFGVGWALTGACPGTSFVQLGSGHWGAAVTIVGAVIGMFAYRRLHQRYFSWPLDTCG